ncbi:MAG: hypothetical protein ABI137_12900 [Antricoccus sp.]
MGQSRDRGIPDLSDPSGMQTVRLHRKDVTHARRAEMMGADHAVGEAACIGRRLR